MKIIFSVEELFVVEPLGLMQMVAVAKNLGHDCYFSPYHNITEFLKYIKKIKPDVVAFSIMSISHDSCLKMISKIKKYNKKIFIVVGGPHPTHYPQFVRLSETDAICVGEGDYAFADFLKTIEKGKSMRKIANIWTKSSKTPLRDLVADIDSLPFPDRDLIYRDSNLGLMKLKSFMATRGCPYACTYCFNSAYKNLYKGKGAMLRRRSVDSLIQEIKKVKMDYPLGMIRFGDDNFIEGVNEWLEEFVKKYNKEIKLPFYCLLRPDVVTPKLARMLRKAGCVSVATSIETGNERIRRELLQRIVTDKQIVNACRILTRNGINTYTNIMVGLPEATLSDEFKSLDLAFQSKTTCAAFTIFTPFPGTPLHKYCLDKGYIPKTNKFITTASSRILRRHVGDEGAAPAEGGSSNAGVRSRHQHKKAVGLSKETPSLRAGGGFIFPRSTTDRSMLNCFTEKEKDIQRNIMLLGTLANGSKPLRKIITKLLIYWPPNKVFFYLSFIVRNYYNYRYIWPIPLNIKEFFEMVGVVRQHDRRYIE